MTKTTGGESTIISPSSPRAASSATVKGHVCTKSETKVKSTRKSLSKKPQRSSSFKSQSKSPLKPILAKSQYNQYLLMLRDALVEYTPHREEDSQLEILRNAKEYIIHLQQLIHQDDQQQIVVGQLSDLTF
ncbi:hypothetical protein LOD99_5871 [Oopsacas minuta]|uniref:BHLH domain-containing protein n=1 Tax=Oopsacas minuta TaxID=111878 RepID=A0AAV7JPH8_9METZ|nr:hypothetical protein LOD99_5871 [Oopsacas minuta]